MVRAKAGNGWSRAWVAYAAALAVLVASPPLSRAAVPPKPAAPAAPVEPPAVAGQARLNPTGKAISMPVPLKSSGQVLGEIIVKISTDDTIELPKATLASLLEKQLDPPSHKRLDSVRDKAGLVAIAALKDAGFDVKFDPGLMEIGFEPSVDQKPIGDISLGSLNNHHRDASAATVAPAAVSGFLNLYAGVDQQWGAGSGDTMTGIRLGAESVFRMWNIVVENELNYDGRVDLFNCPLGARCFGQHTEGWKRRYTRGIYDLPDHLLRLQFGDAIASNGTYQSAPDILGFAIEHSPRKLAPGESIRPTGRASFRIERPAEIDVLVNGAILQRLRLGPGNYNLSDLPLQAGANDIELVVTDDTGERRTLSFKSFHDVNLLREGKTEWAFTGGKPSFIRDNERVYRDNDWMGTGFLRYGMTDRLTAEVHAQADNYVAMGGAGIFASLPYGFASLHGSASQSSTGVGFSANASYDLINFSGILNALTGRRESLRFAADFRTAEFRTPGEFQSTASGILFPQYNYALRLNSAYTVQLSDKVSATLSGRYQIGEDRAYKTSPLTVSGNRYGVDLTVSSAFSSSISGSFSVGYSNDSFLRDFTNSQSERGDFRVGVRLNIRPSERTRIASGYDSLNNTMTTSASWYERRGTDRWDASADFGRYGYDDRATAGATVGYTGNRIETRLTHTAGVTGLGAQRNDAGLAEQRTSARVGAAIAFAGDKVAIGAPIRGNGFAIVDTHENIAGKPVTVGNRDTPRATSGILGPALVTDLPAYSPTSLAVDVDDLPLGYSLGQGTFDVNAPYRGGYALQVGSSYSVSAFGTLSLGDGEPVALLTGVAAPEGNAKKQVAIFTNAAGKFGADGLAPGRWVLDMATEGAPTRFIIEIPKGANGLVQLGTLKPAKP